MDNYQEKLDIVNEDDNIIGQDTRENIHQHGLLHREIHVIVYNDKGEILFQKRAKDKDICGGLLDVSVGGHVDLGEDYEEAAIKELEEETGISVDRKCLVFLEKKRSNYSEQNTGRINNTYRSIYSYKYNGDVKDLKVEKGKADSLEFWSLDDILNLTEENKKMFIDKFISGEYLEIYKELLNK